MLLTFAAATLLSLAPLAQTPPPPAPPSEQKARARKRRVIRLEAITVEGRIQKPQAFYILQRSNLSFGELSEPEGFLPKILKSVEKEPF
jgi:hypothetical protein